MPAEDAHFTFVHFTDTHMMAGATFRPADADWELDTQVTLARVIEAVNTLEPQPAFATIGGDLTSPDLIDRRRHPTPEAYEPSYRLLQRTLEPLACPVYMLLGNHDDRAAFHRVMKHTVTSPPSTCFQISRVSQTRRFFPGPPGFRVVRVNGLELSTKVLYLHEDRADAV